MMMAIWQLILLLGNSFLHLTSLTNQDTVMYFTFKLCMTDGIVDSIEEATEAGNCSLQKIEYMQYDRYRLTVRLNNMGIKDFKKYWYQIADTGINAIELFNNSITHFSPNLVNDLPSNIRWLDLSRNDIRIIEKNLIKNDHLRELFFTNNEVIIEDGAFKDLKITDLYMDRNSLRSSDFIKSLPATLEVLDLSNNLIQEISNDTFNHLKNLRAIFLYENNLTKLEPGTFNNLEYLRMISLDSNKIRELKTGSFRDFKTSCTIDIANNQIKMIHPGAFESLHIRWLGLMDNRLKTIKRDSFRETWIGTVRLGSDVVLENGVFNGSEIIRDDGITDI